MNSFINRYRKTAKEPAMLSFEEPTVHDEAEARWFVERVGEGEGVNPVTVPVAEILTQTSEVLKEFVGDEVKAAVESLPVEFRMVVLLSDLEGFSYQEISEILSLNLGTVKSRLFRGRKILQDLLFRYAKEHGLVKGRKP